jgi:G:T/U-mismatch repair DNA glycosylase
MDGMSRLTWGGFSVCVGISTSAARRSGAFVVEAKQNKVARVRQVR